MKIKNFYLVIFFASCNCLAMDEDDFFASATEPLPTPPPPTVHKAPDYQPPEPLVIPIDIPVLGTMNFTQTDKGFDGAFAEKDKKFAFGPLSIDGVKAQINFENNKSVVSLTGRATLFSKKATVGLKEYDMDAGKYVLGLTYDQGDKPRLELIPGAPFIIDATDVQLQKDKPVVILAYTKVGDKNLTLTLIVQKNQTDLTAQADALGLADLIISLKNTPLSDVQLTNISLSFPDMLNKSGEKGISGTATAGMQKPIIPGVTMADMTFSFQAKKDGSNDGTLAIKTCSIEKVGGVANAQITMALKPKTPPYLLFTGVATANFIELGQIQAHIKTELKQGFVAVTGTLAQPISFAGLSITNGTVTYDGQERLLTIAGIAQVYGYTGKFSFTKSAAGVVQSTVAIDEKEIKPFAKIPGISDLALNAPVVTFIKNNKTGDYDAVLSGKINGDAITISRTPTSMSATVDRAKISTLFPRLQKTGFDSEWTDIALTIKDIDGAGKQPTVTISGVANLSAFGAGMQGGFDKAVVTVTLDEKAGDSLIALIAQVTVPGLGAISQAKIHALLVPNQPAQITFSGELTLHIADIGDVRVLIDSTQKDGAFAIVGTLAQTFSFAGFTITQGQFKFDSKDNSILLSGITDVYGDKGSFIYSRSAAGAVSIKIEIDAREIHPFALVPGLQEVTLSSPVVLINKDVQGNYQATLTGSINGNAVRISRSPTTVSCSFERVTLAQLFSFAKMGELAALALSNATLSIVDMNTPGKTPTTTFSGTMQMTGPFTQVAALTSVKEALFTGVIGKGGTDIACTVQIPGQIGVGNIARITNLALVFAVSPQTKPTYNLKNELSLSVPGQGQPLIFDTLLNLSGGVGTLDGSMRGSWLDPLGMKGLKISDATIKASYIFATHKLSDVFIEGDVSASPVAGKAGVQLKGDLMSDQHSFIVTLPSKLKIASKLPGLKALDGLTLEDVRVIYSLWDYDDTELKLSVKNGLNFSGTVVFVGPLAPVAQLTKLKQITIAGAIPKTGVGSQFSAQLPGEFSFGPLGKATDLSLVMALETAGPEVGIAVGNLALTVPNLTLPQFSAKLLLGSTMGTVDAQLKEPIKDPFGIKGLTITNVAIQNTSFTYSAPPVITQFGISGRVQLGNKFIDIAGASEVGKPLTLVGQLGDLSLKDVVSLWQGMLKATGVSLDVTAIEKAIPAIGLKNASLYLVPQSTTIAGRAFEKGFSITADGTILGKKASFLFRETDGTIQGDATIDSIDAGIFKLTGVPEGNKQTNPSVHIVMGKKSKKPAELFINGNVELKKIFGGIQARTRIDFEPLDTMSFMMQAHLSDIFVFDVEASAGGALMGVPTEFSIKAVMQQQALSKFTGALSNGIRNTLGDKSKVQKNAVDAANACKAKFGG